MNKNFRKSAGNETKKTLGQVAGLFAAAVVFSFLALLSWQFFTFIFQGDFQYYAPLAFGLTGGSALLAVIIIKSGHADTKIRKVAALAMLLVGTVGELITAGYGVQVEGLLKQGITTTTLEMTNAMANTIKALGFVHALILFAFYLYDDINAWFADENQNGIPDGFESQRLAVGLNQDIRPTPKLPLSDNGNGQKSRQVNP